MRDMAKRGVILACMIAVTPFVWGDSAIAQISPVSQYLDDESSVAIIDYGCLSQSANLYPQGDASSLRESSEDTFRRNVLKTAQTAANAIQDPVKKGFILAAIARNHACFSDFEQARSILDNLLVSETLSKMEYR